MKFLTAISVLVLAFVTIVDGAMAAPFTIGQAVATVTSNSVTGNPDTCNNYNDQVLNHGAPLNGDHAGYCQFSTAQIMLNGVPFDKFWQDVSTGIVPPPYVVSYSFGLGPGELCATAKNLKIEVSMQVQTSRLDWPGAASVGQACLSEWNAQSPANPNIVSTPTNATALSAVKRMVNYLNLTLRSSPPIQACVSQRLGSRTQAFAALAKKIKNFMRPWVMAAQYSLPADASGDECKLHCNVCSSGWAGTIKATRTYSGTDNYTETDMFYVGGVSSIANHIPAEWTTNGGPGSSTAGGFKWKLHADIPGQCDPAAPNPGVCIQALTQGNVINFSETNNPVPAPGAYDWSQNGIAKMPEAATESQINSWMTGATVQAVPVPPAMTATTAVGQNPTIACSSGPPSLPYKTPGGCIQVWEWNLVKQP